MKLTGAITAAVLAATLSACGGGSAATDAEASTPTPTPTEPEAITVGGTLTLIDADIWRYGGECSGSDGYDDISAGAQVLIRDGDGTAIAKGVLEPGEPENRVTCVFPFTVADVPVIEGLYSIEVAHRGEIMFSADEAADIALTLG